jgi:colicin import membrane protein
LERAYIAHSMADSQKSSAQAKADAKKAEEAKQAEETAAAEAKRAEETKRAEDEAAARKEAERRENLGLPADAPEDQVRTAEEEAAVAAKVEEEPRFEIEDLLANARTRLGVSRYVAAGALSKEKRKTLTVSEAKEQVDAFAKRKVGEES